MDNRLIKPVMPDIIRNLSYLIDFLKKERGERETQPVLHTSPYYRWLAYSIIRRELFEQVRQWMDKKKDPDDRLIGRLHSDLIDVWRELKDYKLEGPIRSGVMHEVLYWLASLRAQKRCDSAFFVAPIHEGIPTVMRTEEEMHFRGDFCIFWKGASGQANAAVVDVKSSYGNIIRDKRLFETAHKFGDIGLQFFIASPDVHVSTASAVDFEYMKEKHYLFDLAKSWAHRSLPNRLAIGPFPTGVTPPWLVSQ